VVDSDKIIFFVLCALLIFAFSVDSAGAVSVVSKPTYKWTCYDYSIDFSKNNPEWGVVTVSPNQLFKGQESVNHIVNYKLVSNSTVRIHDGLYGIEYDLNLTEREKYYHFWTEGTPSRRWVFLQDNTEEFLQTAGKK